MRGIRLGILLFACVGLVRPQQVWPQAAQLKTADAVLDRYKQALGGVQAIAKVQSETVRGEIEGTGLSGKATFVSYAKPFKSIFKVTHADGSEVTQDLTAKFRGRSMPRDRASTKTPPSKPCAATPTCNTRSISPTISKISTSPA
ncbi:MAG: hypothetical protein WA651_01495 [Candidatus Sulfotelmatobacter sp.]